jgi:hypothetical protein
MNKKQFDKYLTRDGGCVHCGRADETLIPHHRANRGFGGSKALDVPSNIVVLCSQANLLLESNSTFAALGRSLGWKLTAGESPLTVPVNINGRWYLLNNDYQRVEVLPLPEQ